MKLSTWDPFAEMDAVLSRYRPQVSKANTEAMKQADWYPSVDVSESDENFHVHADLPGVKKEDMSISVNEGVLTVSGKRESRHEETNNKLHRVERSYGSFTRSFTLPDNVNAKSINASFEEGVLNIDIPKSNEEKPKRIQVDIK
ncbi:Hsp20/alpha crystallin family protein [Oceaniserpentilla sp. 4NH20-0058]|uniref:Hsp20/alpha crystallin family protein n=1 Tax=Oceaniserpentilla sp. 4NH20-0058 TaxID=3127660 RepID=UPI00310BFCEA